MSITYSHPEVSATSVVDALVAAGFEAGRAEPVWRTVLDTFDGRLEAAGLRLELQGGRTRDLVLDGDPAAPPARMTITSAPTWPHELPTGPFRDRIATVTQERALLPLVTIASTVRSVRRLDRRGKTTVQIDVHDQLSVDDGEPGALLPWAAEVHAVAGHADAAELAATRLAMLGLEPSPQGLTGLLAGAAGVSLKGRSSSPTVDLEPDEDALVAYRRVLANLADTIAVNVPGTIADTDPEFLHELRVGVRRTRSVLSQAKGVLPEEVRTRFRATFERLGLFTGPPRDLDVYLLGWDAYVAPLSPEDIAALEPVRTELDARRRAAHAELARSLRGRDVRSALDAWRRWLADPDVRADTGQPVGPIIAARIARAQGKVLRDGRVITPESPPELLHDLRKDAKKLRYLLECFGGVLDPKPRKAFVNQLKSLQDNLGDHQDAEVHIAELRFLAQDLRQRGVDTDVLLAIGRLNEHLDRRRLHERRVFAERFTAYDTRANRRALDQLLAPVASE